MPKGVRADRGAFDKKALDKDKKQVTFRVHPDDWDLGRSLLEKDDITFQTLMSLFFDMYLAREPIVVSWVQKWKDDRYYRRFAEDTLTLSDREKRSLLDEIELGIQTIESGFGRRDSDR